MVHWQSAIPTVEDEGESVAVAVWGEQWATGSAVRIINLTHILTLKVHLVNSRFV